MFVTNWNSTTKIQKISEITNFLGTISYPELRYILTTLYKKGHIFAAVNN